MNEPFGVTGIKDQVRFLQGKLKEAREERDEARAELAQAMEAGNVVVTELENFRAQLEDAETEAEARGFERGVQEAAKWLHERRHWKGSYYEGARDAILALLEPTPQEQSK
jgi:regulator of replication initiation timing